ncbi:MAG: hypothetical protein R3F59_10980 [Myxococcota bacterium]
MSHAATEADLDAFWDWWIGSEEALVADVEEDTAQRGILGRLLRRVRGDLGRGLQAAVADVDEALALVHPGISCDYGPEGWVFTALAQPAAWRALQELLAACPAGVADRPLAGVPRRRRDAVRVGDVTIHRGQVRWVSVLRDQGLILGLVVAAPEGATPAQIEVAAGRFVCAELGEEMALRLQEWRVISPDSQSAQSARPLDGLLPRMQELLDGVGPQGLPLPGRQEARGANY